MTQERADKPPRKQAPPELLVVTKTYDLLRWTAGHLPRFPRPYRASLGERLESRLAFVLDRLVRAQYNRDRAGLLREVNLELELLRFWFRLAWHLRCLSTDAYEFATRSVNEIGRMVGGWIRSGRAAEPSAVVESPS